MAKTLKRANTTITIGGEVENGTNSNNEAPNAEIFVKEKLATYSAQELARFAFAAAKPLLDADPALREHPAHIAQRVSDATGIPFEAAALVALGLTMDR